MKVKIGSTKGITLIELLIVFAISSIIMVLIYTVLIMSLKMWKKTEDISEVKQNANYAINMLLWDIRHGDSVIVRDHNSNIEPNTIIILYQGKQNKYSFRPKSQNTDRIGKLFKNSNQVCFYMEDFKLSWDQYNHNILIIEAVFGKGDSYIDIRTAVNIRFK